MRSTRYNSAFTDLLQADYDQGWEHNSLVGNYTHGDLEHAHCSAVGTLGHELRCGQIRQHAQSEQAAC